MCYSSQIASAYQQYLKLTGATIDFDQFKELYGFRYRDSSIRIAPAVDRWFDEPKNADERAIRELIDRHRAEAIARLEGEVFVQRKRLADAERKLQAKPTAARILRTHGQAWRPCVRFHLVGVGRSANQPRIVRSLR